MEQQINISLSPLCFLTNKNSINKKIKIKVMCGYISHTMINVHILRSVDRDFNYDRKIPAVPRFEFDDEPGDRNLRESPLECCLPNV